MDNRVHELHQMVENLDEQNSKLLEELEAKVDHITKTLCEAISIDAPTPDFLELCKIHDKEDFGIDTVTGDKVQDKTRKLSDSDDGEFHSEPTEMCQFCGKYHRISCRYCPETGEARK